MSLADDLKAYQSMMLDARSGENISARFNRFRKVACSKYQRLESDNADWLLEQLHLDDRDRDTDAFVAVVLGSIERLSDRFFEPLLDGGIRERNPSKNRYLIEPAVRVFGYQRVAKRLLESLSDGTNSEKSGAVNACYWARVAARDDPEP